MQNVVINCETGQETYVDLTADEQTAYDERQAAAEQERQATEQASQQRTQALATIQADPHFQAFSTETQQAFLSLVGGPAAG